MFDFFEQAEMLIQFDEIQKLLLHNMNDEQPQRAFSCNSLPGGSQEIQSLAVFSAWFKERSQ